MWHLEANKMKCRGSVRGSGGGIIMEKYGREQNEKQNSLLRRIPRMDTLLAEPGMCQVMQEYGKSR